MRILKLEQPRMSGPDVQDWQQFLMLKGHLLEPTADGTFGPKTSAATRAYQTAAGLSVDGAVGSQTLLRALRDGLTLTTRTVSLGFDTNRNCQPFLNCLNAEGMAFAARYYCKSTSQKRLSKNEAKALSQAGLKIAVVYQDAQDGIEHFNGVKGKASAKKALEQAADIGQPAGSAIYFACDFDPSADETRGPVTEFFHAVNAELAAATVSYKVGVYGSGLVCRVIRDASLASFAWLAGATGFRETSAFRPRAHLLQILPSRSICSSPKLEIDDDIAFTADFGGFSI
ncbi:hypothetical protein F183_A03170 [Bryobacterales bacterium F-183]|nr:hypothetical protein F183_A03170 [Bryobacterales bacterium F-183]